MDESLTGDEDSVIGPISQGIVLNRWGKRRFMFDSSQSLHRGVMPARFKYFNEGAESWMWGYGLIDRDGNCIAMPSYSYVGGFSDGFAPVRIENSAGSYSSWLDVSGTIQFSSKKLDSVGQYSEERFLYTHNGFCGWLTFEGDEVLPKKYTSLGLLFDSRAYAFDGVTEVILNQFGDKVFALDEVRLQPMMNGRFSDGLLWVEHNSGQKMALNTEGDVVIELQIPDQPVYWVQNFSEGLAGFGAGQAGCGFVDKDGNIAIETRFSDVRQFSEGVAAVEMEGLWGFINTDGQSVIPTIFEEVKRFSHGFAAVKTSKADVSWTYVNKDGSLLTEETFFDALPFHDGVALIARSDDEFHSILYSDGSTVEIPVKSHAW